MEETGEPQQTVVYLKELYDACKGGFDIGRIADKVIVIYRRSESVPEADILQDWEKVKDTVQIRLVKKEWNLKSLKNWVYREYLDFAVVLAVEIFAGGELFGSVPVKKEALEYWGVSEDEIYRKAMENLSREDYAIIPMDRLLPAEIPKGEQEMYVLMRGKKSFGAGLMLREDIFHRFAGEQGCSLYIIPCSVHELVLVKQEEDTDGRFLKEALEEADRELLIPEDRLSDNIYYYDREKREITIVP